MSFDREYPNRKDRRKPYIRRGAAARSCRPHGGCPYCASSRFHAIRRRELTAEEQVAELHEEAA